MYRFAIYILLLLFLNDQINSQSSITPSYQRLASLYCYIDDYSTWSEEETSLNYFLQFALYFNLDSSRIEQELERYRLQHECLRAVERLPIIMGKG
ncbi:unnamed protein product [Adineta steineri]|uniref:Uncharacterized protein n=1 Tax=Adineta steineri TaxID=433720 RepID=A0A814AX16_9BILA|nr:unnamed protein product [Adineta steineri]CAF1108810.1 unnamed protein product [Adineta steineri]CAF3603547.1 unnamed protein product [Adineta steineri]